MTGKRGWVVGRGYVARGGIGEGFGWGLWEGVGGGEVEEE